MLQEFKKFIMRGNVIDLSIGIIIGGAFGAIVNSIVKDMIMPPVGMILGRVNFSDLFLSLNGKNYESLKAAQDAGAPTLNYGLFLQTAINFLIIACVIFLIMRAVNRLEVLRATAPATPTTKECPYCLSGIPLKATRCPHCTSELK